MHPPAVRMGVKNFGPLRSLRDLRFQMPATAIPQDIGILHQQKSHMWSLKASLDLSLKGQIQG